MAESAIQGKQVDPLREDRWSEITGSSAEGPEGVPSSEGGWLIWRDTQTEKEERGGCRESGLRAGPERNPNPE